MPSPPNNRFPEGEPRTGLQPTEPPTNAKPTPRPTSRGTTFPTKMAIAARLLGKEIYRNKLKWFDLRRADYRLGEKVVAAGIPSEHSQFAPQLEQIDKRLASLRQFQHERSDTFGEKVKSWANGIVRMAQIAAGKRRRHRLLKQLGAAVRKNPGADRAIAGELESANLITEKISSVDAAIRNLRRGTYLWARRPLLFSSLLIILTIVGLLSFKAATQQPFGSRENSSSSLSEDQFKTLEKQTAAFREQLRRQQAEMARQEAEATQARIAAAERQYKEQRDRERAEVQKRAREQAQKDEQARREQADREKQQQQLAAAEQARLEIEEAEAEKLAREKAERAAAAERTRKEEERRTAQLAEEKRQHEQAGRDTQNKPANDLVGSQIEKGKASAAAMMGNLPKYPFPYDPELLDKLYKGRLDEIGPNRLDLIAVAKAFQRAGAIEIGRELISGIIVDGLTTVQMHPNYWMTAGILDATGGLDGEWARTTSANLLRVLRDRSEGKFSSNTGDAAKSAWPLKMRLVVPVDDSDFRKPMQGLSETERAAVEKQIKELAAKGAKVYLADYGDPNARSNYKDVHLVFWYGDVPILRRDLLAVSKAHPLANLGNLAVTEVPQTLGEANRKHAEALAAEYKKVEATTNIDNSRYIGWKGFAPGANATYAKNTRREEGGRKQPAGNGSTEVRTLQSIDDSNAVVKIDDKVQTFAAKVRDNRGQDEQKAPTEQEVELNGKTFKCSRRSYQWKDWDRRITTTTWTNDEVPGGLVRLLEDEEDPNGLHIVDDTTLQSYTGGKNDDWSGQPAAAPATSTTAEAAVAGIVQRPMAATASSPTSKSSSQGADKTAGQTATDHGETDTHAPPTSSAVESIEGLRRAAEAGDAEKMLRLGNRYRTGGGVQKDFTEAMRWYRKAADAGQKDALLYLGIGYYNGYGVDKDVAEALRWYRKADDAGNANAMGSLGYAYFKGEGVAQDPAEAERWYRKAADAGNMDAIKILQSLQESKKLWDNMLVLSDGRHVAVDGNGEFHVYKSMIGSDQGKITGAAKEEAKRLLEERQQKQQRNP